MSNFKDRDFEASDLRKAGDFEKALHIYRDLWREEQDQFSQWSTWSYAKCAQKCDEHDEAERIARVCVERWPDFSQGRTVLAWSHYYRHFRDELPKNQPVPKTYWDAAEEVVKLCSHDPHSKYAPFVRIVFRVVKFLEDRKNSESNVNKRIDWLGRLDPDQLSRDSESFRDADGKLRTVASDRENWYAHMSKALLDSKQYEECIVLCEEAKSQILDFHYDNDIWFGKRIAQSKAGLGRTEEALEDYKRLAAKKNEWFIYYDIACLAHKLGQHGDALRHASEAALARSPLHFKSSLFLLIAVLLRDDGRDDLAKRHAQLSASARSEHGWSPKGRMLELFQEFDVEIEGGGPAKDLEKGLKKHWAQWRVEMLPPCEGEIDWIHKEKPFGFIKVDGQKDSVYFHVKNLEGPRECFEKGSRVSFRVQESYDSKKEKMSNQCINITPIV